MFLANFFVNKVPQKKKNNNIEWLEPLQWFLFSESLQHKSESNFDLFCKRKLVFHAVVLVKTFLLMYQLLPTIKIILTKLWWFLFSGYKQSRFRNPHTETCRHKKDIRSHILKTLSKFNLTARCSLKVNVSQTQFSFEYSNFSCTYAQLAKVEHFADCPRISESFEYVGPAQSSKLGVSHWQLKEYFFV